MQNTAKVDPQDIETPTNFEKNEEEIQIEPMGNYPSGYTNWFGPCAWKFLHSVSFTYPDNPNEEQKIIYRDFFTSLSTVLPCPGCAMNWRIEIGKNPLTDKVMSSKYTLSKWLYERHKQVNLRLGKPAGPSFEEVKRIYTNFQPESLDGLSNEQMRQKLGTPFHEKQKDIPTYLVAATYAVLAFFVVIIILFIYFKIKG
jgi:hypothetical protein